MSFEYENEMEKNQMDAEVIKTHYPRDNNAKVLSFVIQEWSENVNVCFIKITLKVALI